MFLGGKETSKDAHGCDSGLCKFVGYFHVFPTSHLQRRKGPALAERDLQKMHRVKSLYDTVFQTPEEACDELFCTFSTFEIRN